MDEFKDAMRLFFDKNNVARYNYEKLKKLRNAISRISAVHSGLLQRLMMHEDYNLRSSLARSRNVQ